MIDSGDDRADTHADSVKSSAILPSKPTTQIRGDLAAEGDTLESELTASDWPTVLSGLGLAGMARELASNCELVEFSHAVISLRLSSDRRHLLSKAGHDKLATALVARYGKRVVTIEVGQTTVETPAEVFGRQRAKGQQNACLAIESDRVIQELIESLDATLIAASIRPVSGE